ncbi:MAG: alginate export family protein, partial [Vicinamibacterales bacterium]
IWYARNWTRAELWHFFEPPAGGGNNEYIYAANRLQLGVRRSAPRFDLTAALQYVQFGGLPTDAVGPGPLGLGAVYFAHANRSDSHQVYLRYLNVRWKDLLPGLSLQAGRMAYSSGGESASGNTKIEAVKRQRVDARLVGEFEWSIYQRAYDGIRVDLTRPGWSSTFLGFRPTQGGFEDAGGASMSDVTVLGGNATIKPRVFHRGVEWQAFGFRYIDDRHVAARPDNSGRRVERIDVAVNTFGTTIVAASEPRAGRQWDALLWLVGQTGSWFDQTHRASSVAAEIGHQWTTAAWRPWLRVGILRASGDDDPADDRHGTFFQMLPTVRRYSQTAAYSQMNNADLFVQALLRPANPITVRVDIHRVGLTSSRDLWYFGSGATQSRGTLFGFSTRPSNGSTHLGALVEGSMDYVVSPHWSIGGYTGVIRGGDVVRRAFTGRTMAFAFLESSIQF